MARISKPDTQAEIRKELKGTLRFIDTKSEKIKFLNMVLRRSKADFQKGFKRSSFTKQAFDQTYRNELKVVEELKKELNC